jgi:cell division protein FtsI (penicillin-binding protein 3)
MYSSNIGVAKMALEVGTNKQKAFMEKMGFFDPLNIEIPENGKPLKPRSWQDITTATISYGYGLAISPLQLANGVAAIINGGILNKPTIIKDGNHTMPQQKVISSKTSDQMRKLLHLVVKKGTGKKSDVDGYVVGGKTGSANKKEGKGYAKKGKHRALYAGAFPMNDPKYVILIMLDEPKGTKETFGFSTGGWVSAPIAKEVIKRAAPLLGVLPIDEKSPKIKSAMRININRKETSHAIG